MLDIKTVSIIHGLTSLPHRGTGTPYEKQAADMIVKFLHSAGADVERQVFKTSKTYIWEIIVLTTLIATGLAITPWFPFFSVGIILFCSISSLLYFDWRSSPLSLLSPTVKSENIIGRLKDQTKEGITDEILSDKEFLLKHGLI